MAATPEVVLAVMQWINETYPNTVVSAYDLQSGKVLGHSDCSTNVMFMEINIRGGLPAPLASLDVVFGTNNARIICWSKNEMGNKVHESVSYNLADQRWIAHLEKILDMARTTETWYK